MEANRDLAHSLPVLIRSVNGGYEWTVNTYGPDAVNSDDYYAENMVISDLPAGNYEVRIAFPGNNKTDKLQVSVQPGRVTYFVYRATLGFTSTAPPAAITPTPQPSPSP
jgi:hypothetical protein